MNTVAVEAVTMVSGGMVWSASRSSSDTCWSAAEFFPLAFDALACLFLRGTTWPFWPWKGSIEKMCALDAARSRPLRTLRGWHALPMRERRALSQVWSGGEKKSRTSAHTKMSLGMSVQPSSILTPLGP